MTGRRLRVGLVGANWGVTHVAAWQSLPDVELAAICTSSQRTADAAAQARGIPHAYGETRAWVRLGEFRERTAAASTA
jgi:predicted dehydrogenase